jgi:hypothetical protein
MSGEQFAWGDAHFVGDWTLEDVVAFVQRVGEIRVEEQARLAPQDDDESRACIGVEVKGCEARIQPGESADDDVPVCRDCYGEGRQS